MPNQCSPVHVAFAVDKRFLGYTAVAALSATLATESLHVQILHGGDLGRGAENISWLVNHHGGKTHFYKIDLDNATELPIVRSPQHRN